MQNEEREDHDFDDGDIPDEDQVIEKFLGVHPRASDVRAMRIALVERRKTMRREQAQASDERERTLLGAKIAELNRQIAVMREEEAITQFVENSVRVTLYKPEVDDGEE